MEKIRAYDIVIFSSNDNDARTYDVGQLWIRLNVQLAVHQ